MSASRNLHRDVGVLPILCKVPEIVDHAVPNVKPQSLALQHGPAELQVV